MAARDCHEMMRLGYGKVSNSIYNKALKKLMVSWIFFSDFAKDQLKVLPWRVDHEDRGALGV